MGKFLLNLIGDIHQPWNTISRFTPSTLNGDENGNLFSVVWKSESSIKTLHKLWDRGFSKINEQSRPFSSSSISYINNWASQITS